MVRVEGVEPSCLATSDFESDVYSYSTTPAYKVPRPGLEPGFCANLALIQLIRLLFYH